MIRIIRSNMAEPRTATSILFLAPSFLSYRLHKKVRGVEVFDIHFVRQLVELGHEVTLVAESTWRKRFDDLLAGSTPEIIYTPSLRKPLPNGVAAAAMLSRRRFDVIILANAARGMIPMIRMLHRMRVGTRFVQIAHRKPRDRYLRALRGLPLDVLAVNDSIAEFFSQHTTGTIRTQTGVPNPDEFFPRTVARSEAQPVRFCMLGKLDTPIKGVDRVIRAFQAIPEELRNRAELHLASYPEPPTDLPQGVIAYEWMHHDHVADFLREMDVIVIASEHETFCQAVVQGMLTELASLVVDLPILTEKLDEGGGLIFHTDEEMTAQMVKLIENADLRRTMGSTGVESHSTATSGALVGSPRIFSARPAQRLSAHPRDRCILRDRLRRNAGMQWPPRSSARQP